MFRKKLEKVFSKNRKSPRKSTRHYAIQTDYQLLEARHVLATILWDGGGVDPTAWGDPQNWVGDVLPGSTDDAVIDIAANPTIIVSSDQTVNSVVSEEAIALTGGTFTLNADSEFNATLSLSAPATLDITSSTATLSGQLDWNASSTIRGSGGTLDVTAGGVVNVDNGVLDNVTLNNEGVVNQVRNLTLTDATINNLAGGTWNWNATAGYAFNGTGSVFNNQSQFVKTGNSGIPRFDIPFVNETGGTLQVSEGNLSLPSSATHSGVFDVTSQLFFGGDHDFESGVDFTGPGIINFNSGTFDFLSGATYAYAGATNFNTSSVTVFQPGATLDLIDANLFSTLDITTNTATLSGQLDWTNTSTIRGSGGTLNVASGGVINGGNAVLENVTLNNEGVVNHVEFLTLTDATINNLAGGTWNWNAIGGFTFNGTGSVFNNQSQFVKTGNSGIPRFDIPFVNETGGTLQVSEGNLSLPSSATHSGVFDVTSQLFFSGDHDFESGVDFTGPGIINFNSGTFDFLSGSTYAFAGATNFNTSSVTVFQPGATLNLIDANLFSTLDITTNTATLSGQLDWTNTSTIRGSGGTLNVTAGGVINVDNAVLDNVTLNNEGVVNQVRSLTLTDATINNLSGGTWNWNALGSFAFNGTGSVFNNQSQFVKTGNSGIPRFDIPFVNETGGTLQVSEGNLSLPSSATHSGVFDVTSQLFFSGDHDFESGVDFTGTGIINFNSGTFDFLSGSTYAFAGVTNFNTGSVTVFQPGATLDLIDANLFSTSTLDITSNTATLSGQLDWTNTSTIRGSGGTLNVASGGVINGGNAVLDNVTLNNEGVVNHVEFLTLTDATINNLAGGTWNWNALGSFAFNGTGSVFNNQSQFVKTGNSGIPRFDIPFVNETGGTLQVSEGNLSLPSSATHSGVFDVTSQLFFIGDHDFESGVDFTGTGIINFNSGTFDFLSGSTYAFAGATNFNTSSVTVFQPGATLDLIDANLFSTLDITTNTATLSGQLDWTNTSTIRGSGGTLDVTAGGVINVDNAVLDNVTLNNEGVVNQVRSLTLTDATINNLSGGTWNWNALGSFAFNGTGSVFNNQSQFVKTGNSGIPRFDIPFVNETGGTLQVSEGNLSLPSSATHSGVFDVTSQLFFSGDHDFESGVDFTGTGIINFNSGTFDFLSGSTYAFAGVTNFNTGSVTVFQPGATLDLIDANLFPTSTLDITSNTATLSGQLDWTNTSTIRGSGGTLNVASGGVVNGGNAVLDNVTLNNEGVVNHVEFLTLTDATINNLSGGTWNWNALGSFAFNGTGSVFNNQSQFVKTGNSGIPRFDIPFVNETGGTLQVSEGNLSLPSSATHSGVFDVTSQLFFIGDHDFESGVDFTGTGIINFNSGTFDFLSGSTYAFAGATNFNTSSVTVFQPGATLNLIDANLFSTLDITTNTATLSGQLDWTNTSTIRGSGGTLNVASGGVINGGNAVLENVTLNNEGVVNHVEFLTLTDATINNLAGGTWNWNATAGYAFNGTGSVFNNQSLFVKTGNAGTPAFNIPFVNETGGTLQVSEGNLSFQFALTNSGNLNVDPGALVITGTSAYTQMDGQTIVNGTLSASDVVINGGLLGGRGNIPSSVVTGDGATVAPGNSPGILNTGDFTFANNSNFEVEIGGTTEGNDDNSHDQLNVSGTVTIGSNVTLDTIQWNGFNPSLNDTFTIINNDGVDAVTGTFAGLAEGTLITDFMGIGAFASISYSGGDGNDVVLTALEVSLMVSNSNDSGAGSLRQAILDSNSLAGITNTIDFSGLPAGTVITLDNNLPAITVPVIIDGYTASGASPNSQLIGSNAVIGIELDGSTLGSTAVGLDVLASDVEIRGLAMTGFGTDGAGGSGIATGVMIRVDSAFNNVTVAGNHLGTDSAGSGFNLGSQFGVTISGGNGHVIGGSSLADRNVISGNDVALLVQDASNVTVSGNYIGVSASGLIDMGNDSDGIWINNSGSAHTIGGLTDAERNVISGNNGNGITISGSGVNTVTILGNYIGTDANGTSAIPNEILGIRIHEANFNTIGGSTSDARNVISGNTLHGIQIDGVGSNNNFVKGNFIGTRADGANPLPNGSQGILVYEGASDNVIGGASPGEGNLISGNGNDGVQIEGSLTNNNRIIGNLIGTDFDGDAVLANGRQGVLISGGAFLNYVGGVVPGEGNVISGNDLDGVQIAGDATTSNVVEGNIIGLTSDGLSPLGNGRIGVLLNFDTSGNTIGGSTVASRNVISGNVAQGILIQQGENDIIGNLVGVDVSGNNPLGNGGNGIELQSSGSLVENNLVSGNLGDGILVLGNGESIDPSAVVWLRGEGDGSDEVGSNDGTLLNGVGFSPGINGDGFLFDTEFGGVDEDEIRVSHDASLDLTQLTIDLWVRMDTVPSAAGHVLVSKGITPTQENFGLYLGSDGDGGAEVIFKNFNGAFRTYSTSGAALQAGDIYHLAATADGATVNLYIDGVNVLSAPQTHPLLPNTGDLQVGNNQPSFANRFDGLLDEIAIYNRALTATEIGAIHAIAGSGKQGARIVANTIGLNDVGDAVIPNDFVGIRINDSAGNLIGEVGTQNYISGNGEHGIAMLGSGSRFNQVVNNLIGTDATGTVDFGNTFIGVQVASGASNNLIGGTLPGTGNLISGNEFDGINLGEPFLSGSGAYNNRVEGNFIGTTLDGMNALGNGRNGISVAFEATGNVVGGSSIAARNLISGNVGTGVDIGVVGVTGNFVKGNYIGVKFDGMSALGNLVAGIAIGNQASNNVIGVDGDGIGDDFEANLISGNFIGILIDTDADSNVVAGNLIGTDKTGNAPVGNATDGIRITERAISNRIGIDVNAPTTLARNVIAGNGANGILVNESNQSSIVGNNIGIGLDGSTPIGNSKGILIENGAADTTIGGTNDDARNIISGNTAGVQIQSGATGVTIQGNHIGTNFDGDAAVANTNAIVVLSSFFVVIGGTGPGAGNVISGNTDRGITLQQINIPDQTTLIQGNVIGMTENGLSALGNGGRGIEAINGLPGSITIGGSADGAGNVISENGAEGIVFDAGTSGHTVADNYIGTDATGNGIFGNGFNGIRIAGGANSITIGGSTDDSRNIISNNSGHGISVQGGFGNTISGNFIGTSINGTTDLGNTGRGISATGSTGNLIGGTTEGERNVIVGNADVGITLASSSDNNIVIGNHISVDNSGDELVGNGWSISISDSANNRIGGGLAGERNIIGQRILISGANQSNTVNNKVQGNYIGIGLSGAALGTASSSGIRLQGMATTNIIGTDSNGANDDSEGNVISNRGVGVVISGSGTDSNVVAGNLIGTNTLGSLPIGNSQYGVLIDDGAENNLIGGTTENSKNVIGGSGLDGIVIRAANGNRILGNYIGTDAQGNDAIANADNGVHILSSSNSIIGVADSGNVISGNGKHGILLERDDATPAVPADNNTIQGNIIGLNADGDSVLGNSQQGIRVSASIGNQIGGTGSGEENVVSGNGNLGIFVTAAEVAAAGTFDGAATIEGNLIGTDSTGTLIGFGNVGGGIFATSLTIIGGSVFGAGNVISGNIGDGISTIESPQIQGNYIGTDVSGSYAIGNTGHGISKSNSDSISIGGSGGNEGNVISGNGNSGIYFSGVSNSTIVGNLIGLSSDGLQPVGNATGITLDLGSTGNTIGGLAPGNENFISGNAAGIAILAPDNSVIGNFIGTKKNGIDALGNRFSEYGFPSPSTVGSYGVYVSSAGTLITENVVADTEGPGIWAQYSSTSATDVFSNWIGTNSSGVAGLGNIDGVLLTDNASGISIGDENIVGSGNVISGNLNVGINAVDVSSLNVQGNWIGVDENNNPLGNSIGVRISDDNPNTTLGSDIANGENVIAFNAKHGVQITVPNLGSLDFRNNQIFGNVLTGIDLGGDDIATPNDDGDLDGYLNFPVITSTVIDGGNLVINGFSGPSDDLRIFVSDPSISGFGQGVFQLGEFREGSVDDLDATSGTYTSADANGLAVGTDTTNRFSFSIPVPAAVELGSLISVYAVGDGDTVSEFSNARIVSEVGTDGPGSSLPPVILPIPNVTIVSGTRLTQTVMIEDFDSTSWTAMVDYGDGTMMAVPVDGRQIALDHVYPGPDDYTVTVTVIDNAQQVTEATFNVLISNEAPSVNVNSFTITSPVNEGAPVTLSGRFTDSGIIESHTVEIDWGDETGVQTLSIPAGEFEFKVSHVYKDNAPLVVYRVAVTVIDAGQESDATPNGVLLAEVRNVDPNNLDIEVVPNSIIEGNAITLNGSFDDPGVLDTHTVTVDWGDGETTIVSLAAGDLDFSDITHTYDDDQAYGVDEYEITVSVTDKEEVVATTASRSIAVINDIPEASNLLLNSMTSATIDENGIVTLEGTIVDSGLNDSHTILIDWGDGSSPTTLQLPMGIETFSQDHRYLDDPEAGATYTISVRVADNDMVFGTFGDANTIDITVLNKAPIIDPAMDATLAPILLTDQFGVELTGPVKEGDTVVLTGYFSDVGTLDRHNIMIDWNDGSAPQQASINSQTRTYTATHTFVNNGLGANDTAGIQITITDDDGDAGNVTTDLIVGNVNPIVLISPDETNVDPNRISLLSKVVDPGSTDTFQYKWEAWQGAVTGAPTQSQVTDSADPFFDPLVDPHFQLDRTGDPDGVYTVRLTVIDDNGGETQFETAILVGSNSADTLTINNATLDDVGATNLMVLGLVGEDVIDASSVTAGYNLILDGGADTDALFGGAGDDTFYLRKGDDSANVTIADGGTFDPVAMTEPGFESGNDRYFLTPNSTLTVIDHSGLNTLDFVNSDFGVEFDLTLADGTSQVVATTFNVEGDEVDHNVSADGQFMELVGSSFGDTLTAADGSMVRAGGGDDMLMVADVDNAAFRGDDGADTLMATGTLGRIDFNGDDGSDVFNNLGNATDIVFSGGADNDVFLNSGSATGMIDFTGDDGADVFENIGSAGDIVFTGGADNDLFSNQGTTSGTINFSGDDGADVFKNFGNASDIIFSGGADNDLFTNTGTDVNLINFNGDDGADLFENDGTATQIAFNGGADNDVFNNNSAGSNAIDFNGDDGADVFNNLGSAADITFTGGADSDVFNNQSTGSSMIDFTGDDGADVFNNLGDATEIKFTGGADNDVFNNQGLAAGTIDFQGDDGADLFENTGNAANIIFTGGADNDVFQNIGGAGSIDFTGDDGADALRNTGNAGAIIFTGGADGDVFLNTGDVTNAINFTGDDGTGTVTGDDGADVFNNSGNANQIVFTGGADNDIFVNSGNVASSIDFTGDDGADAFENLGNVNQLTFTGGADNDVFRNSGAANTISFTGGADSDVFVNTGDAVGDINFTGDDGAGTVTGDDGADIFNNSGNATNIIFTGGADNDVFQNSGNATTTIDFTGDDGADAFRNSGAAQDIKFTGGADNDLFLNSGTVSVGIDFNGDDGADSFQNDGTGIGLIDFDGDDGADLFINNGSAVTSIVFTGGADNDVLVNYGTEIGSINFTGDDGNPATAGETSDDTLVIRGSGDGNGAVLFTGGVGADSFKNDAGGFVSYTFVGGADNDVFLNNADDAKAISFTGGADSDLFENNGDGVSTINFTGDDGADSFYNDGSAVSSIIFTGGADNDLFLNTGEGVSNVDFTGDDGADTFANNGSGLTEINFTGDDGADVFLNQGSGLSQVVFTGGADNDLFWNQSAGSGSSDLNFTGDDGADVFINDAMGVNGISFTGGADNDGFQNTGAGTMGINFSGDDGADALVNTGVNATLINFGGGADSDVFVNHADGVSLIDFRGDQEYRYNPGTEEFEFVPISTTSDDGADTFLNQGNNVSNIIFTGGADNDVLTNNGSGVNSINFTGDDGSDTFLNTGEGASGIVFTGGADNDLFQNSGSEVDSINFTGDDGADTLVNSGSNLGAINFTGDDGADVFINNGAGVSQIVFTGGADGDSLRSLGSGFSSINFTGDTGSDSFIQDGIGVVGSSVSFLGGDDNDLIAWRGSADTANVNTGGGDDYLFVSGAGLLTLVGGVGNDYYVFPGNPNADVTVVEAANADQDTLDFSALTGQSLKTGIDGPALDLDLRVTDPQPQSSEFSITLSDGLGIENVLGTSGADSVEGNARDNIISGADFEDVLVGPEAGERTDVQWVLLDFDLYTNAGGEIGEHVYTQLERDAIQRRMELVYWGPDEFGEPNAADPWFNVRFTQNPSDAELPAEFATVYFNETPSFGRPGGEASEVDLGNLNLAGSAVVQVNGLLGGELTEADQDGSEEGMVSVGQLKPAATSENFVLLAAKIAAHELGHLMGLRHQDSFGPIGSGVHSPPGVDGFNPVYVGPVGGFESFDHLLGSGASIGTDRFNDLNALFFGEREAVKLAYAMSDQALLNVTESGEDHGEIGSAQSLTFATVTVPNTLGEGLNSAKEFFVQAISVIGSIGTPGESDFYSFEGKAGELLNIDLSSIALRRNGDATDTFIDSIIRVYDSSGSLVTYYGSDAINDDEFESSDSSIIDLLLPADGTYYLEVDTFKRVAGDDGFSEALQLRTDLENRLNDTDPENDLSEGEALFLERLQDSLDDTDIGNYQLFVYRFGQANPTDDMDQLKGNGGTDTIFGGPGDVYGLFLDVGDSATSEQGANFTRTITFTDRAASSWTGTVTWGDGSAEDLTIDDSSGAPTFELSHTYSTADTYEVVINISNDIGESVEESFSIEVLVSTAAFDDSTSTMEESPVVVNVLDNDTSTNSVTVTVFSDPTDGVATANSDGTVTYTPAIDFVGDDTFEYLIDDGQGNTDVGMVTVSVSNLVDFDGLVFNDFDNDGVFDSADGEYGLAGVTIEVWTADLSTLIATAETDVDGNYHVNANAVAGDYVIIEVVDDMATQGLLDGNETAGSLGGTVDNTGDSNTIHVSVDDTASDGVGYQFAEIEPSDLFGVVWNDTNNDGLIDMGELGIGDVEITVTGVDDRGNDVTLVTISQADGSYAVVNLRPGTYVITETQLDGYIDGIDSLGQVEDRLGIMGNPGFIDGNDKFSGIELTAGSTADLYNFGDIADTGTDIGSNVTATIGFWRSHWGRDLIKSLNGGEDSTQLGNWMATNFPNLYGAGAVYDARRGRDISMDLTGQTNKQITKVFKYLYHRNHRTSAAGGPSRIDAQLMAVVFATYVTSSNLSGGDYAAGYGFDVTEDGIGASLVDVTEVLTQEQISDLDIQVNSEGKASIMEILTSADDLTTLGLLFDVDGDGDIDEEERRLRFLGNWLYWFINFSSQVGDS